MTYQHHVFLSYSRKDTAMMQRVRDDLRASGLTVWTDEGIEPGTESWKIAIGKAIEASYFLLVILTPEAKNSRWVLEEISYAEKHGKKVFAILAEGDQITAIPFGMTDLQFVDLRNEYKVGIETTIKGIYKNLNIIPITSHSVKPSIKKIEQHKPSNSTLLSKIDVSGARLLMCNIHAEKTFQGLTPGHNGFILSPEQANTIITSDVFSRDVIFPYLTGLDFLAEALGKPSRFIIDMNQYSIVEAQQFSEALKHLSMTVLPDRQQKALEEKAKNMQLAKINTEPVLELHQRFLDEWWKHAFTRTTMIQSISSISRYIVCSRVTMRSIFVFVSNKIRPSDSLQVFAFEDDYHFGILQSSLHWLWFTEKGSTLKSDYRYTSNTVFNTFPFPQNPTVEQIRAVADCSRAILAYRQTIQEKSQRISLKQIYKSLEMPGKNELRDLHTALDSAVISAYGFDPKEDMLTQLLSLNEIIFNKEQAGELVLAPGIPSYYPNPQELVSDYAITSNNF